MKAGQLLRPSNDNHPFEADFQSLPEMFLRAYQQELFGWAKRLTEGNQCEIELWNYPGSSVLSANWQGKVMLQCDAFAHPITKKMRFVIRPATEEDTARIAKHCEELPAIMSAQKAAADAARGTSRKMARWVFDGTVPEYFVLRYQAEIRAWGANLKKVGTIKSIVLREGSLAEMSPDETLGAELVQVKLKCRAERVRGDEIEIVVSALDEEHERRIKKHVEKMERNRIPALVELVEPERPFVPFMPTIDK